jgi:hypothetical protein
LVGINVLFSQYCFSFSGTQLIGKERGTWGNRGTKGD